jgi:hypothetical protein
MCLTKAKRLILYNMLGNHRRQMVSPLYRGIVFALYQLSIVLGIALLPLALAARRVGISLPLGRLVSRLGAAYERTNY